MANWPSITIGISARDLIEDMEKSDAEKISKSLNEMMDSLYPPFEPEILTNISGKEYYLPALKVLEKDYLGQYYSPSKRNRWNNMELTAKCAHRDINFYYYISESNQEPHDAPDENCDCGIYGSVNLEEVESYLVPGERIFGLPSPQIFQQTYRQPFTQVIDTEYKSPKRVLCIIEPSPDAKVILCRKGWKASKVFISEIIPDTMSIDEASAILSMGWHRELDIRRIYNENR